MLIDKIDLCTSSINELSALRTNALSLKTFEVAVNKLTTVDALVTDFVSTIEEMNKHDFCKTHFSSEDIDKLKDSIVGCAALVNELKLTTNDVNTLSAVFQTQSKLLTLTWQSLAKSHVDPIVSYLGVIQSFAGNKDEVKNLIKALGTGSKAEPNAAIVKTLVANVKKANAITSSFQMSTGVRSFLQKAKNGKATLADITPEVSKWISEHQLSSRIKISF